MHPTERFDLHLYILLEALEDIEEFEADLAKAIETLAAYKWDANGPPLTPHGNSGLDFSYPINREFLLVLRRETDRNGEGTPLRVHLYLKTIERIKK